MPNDPALSANQTRELSAFAGTMIPASAPYGVPGADDPAILDDIVHSMGRDLALVHEALAAIAARSGGAFAGLDRDRREALINDYYLSGGIAAAALGRMILGAYYRDDRVMRSLGQEPRPPFPQGHTVEQGDWSLLDPVKARQPFYRRVT